MIPANEVQVHLEVTEVGQLDVPELHLGQESLDVLLGKGKNTDKEGFLESRQLTCRGDCALAVFEAFSLLPLHDTSWFDDNHDLIKLI